MVAHAVRVGSELHMRRLAAGLPIHQVAGRVGLSSSFLAVIENNDREPPTKLAAEIRQAILDLSGGYWDPFDDEYLAPES